MSYQPRSQVDLGGGRGWLTAESAASIFRIDRQIGHRLQITEAGRSFFQQDEHYQRYLRNGYPIALNPNTPSVHQIGDAIDSDEAQNILAIMTDHGWIRTVYRWVNGKWTLVERWHFEHFIAKDNRRNDPAPADAEETPTELLEDMMSSNPIINVVPKTKDDWRGGTVYVGLDDGSFQPLRAPFAENIRGIIGKAFFGGDGDGNKDTIPTMSQADFNALGPVWATMCRGRTDAAAVWAEGVHAQDAEGRALYIDAAGKITTTLTAKPLKFTASGFLASTNALANAAAEESS